MNTREVQKLLAIAASFDNRNLGDAALLAWMQAAQEARWTYAEAERAIIRHYANTTAFIQPGHITELIRADRRDAMSRRRALPGKPPASREHINEVRRWLAEQLGWPSPDTKQSSGTT